MPVTNVHYLSNKGESAGSTINVRYVERDPETLEPTKVVITVEGKSLTEECVRRVRTALYEIESNGR